MTSNAYQFAVSEANKTRNATEGGNQLETSGHLRVPQHSLEC